MQSLPSRNTDCLEKTIMPISYRLPQGSNKQFVQGRHAKSDPLKQANVSDHMATVAHTFSIKSCIKRQ